MSSHRVKIVSLSNFFVDSTYLFIDRLSSDITTDLISGISAMQFVDLVLNLKCSLSSCPSFQLLFHLGQWPSPSGVTHQKKTGLSFEGVSDWRQGGYRQLQHQSSASSHTSGPSEEPAAGTAPRRNVELHMGRRDTLSPYTTSDEEVKKRGIKLGHGVSHCGGWRKLRSCITCKSNTPTERIKTDIQHPFRSL